jgi:hypothetical protein
VFFYTHAVVARRGGLACAAGLAGTGIAESVGRAGRSPTRQTDRRVALARRIAGIPYAMWRDDQSFVTASMAA